MKNTLIVVVLAVGAYLYWNWPTGFSEKDIVTMKDSIKEEFQKKDKIKVVDVIMVKESSRKAVGYVKLSHPSLGEFTKPCSATMDEGGGRFLWNCQ